MTKTQAEWEAMERAYIAERIKARERGAAPLGAAIIRPGSKGVLGVKATGSRPDDPDSPK